MTRFKIKNQKILFSYLAIVLIFATLVKCSEFPERECCDLTTTSTVSPIPIPPASSTAKSIVTSSIQTVPTGRSGSSIKTALAILNCILARQLCFEDPSCSAILEIIPRVCGPIPVACSTVTVTKCQAALRTLQAFPFFRPTCLCKEPGVDPDCNNFRDFLFDHPCGFVLKKEKDPYPIDALPTCNHALSVCQQEKKCLKLFEDFKANCKVRDNKCRMDDRDQCHESWTNLRLSPMFGCICPNNHMKRRCDRIFNVVNHNPCVGGGAQDASADSSSEIIKQHFQSTCHTAMETCKEDPSCLGSLRPMLLHCELHRCNRNACMSALQAFYKGPHEDLSLDVAFCLCKKTSNRHDTCMIAQEKLHPACAQKPPESISGQSPAGMFYHPPPACHVVADLCKEDPDCRSKLELFEQACAVDSVTKKCAGRTSNCRSAIITILGTSLRTTCACQGTEIQHLYQCLGWQKLLWLNPCVVESQKDFHMKRLAELGLLTTPSTTTTTTTVGPTILPITTTSIIHYHRQTTTARPKLEATPLETNNVESPDSGHDTLLRSGNELNGVVDEIENGEDTEMGNIPDDDEDVKPGRESGENDIGDAYEEQEQLVLLTSATEMETITMPTTTSTTTVPTTTQAPRNCVVQRPHQSDQLIPEGNSRRIYSLDDAECSELCTCGESLTLTCHALCVPFAPCRTALAYYSHASPAYQAYRGRCLCYSGRFICMKPPLGEYSLPGGVFLLLGYSSTDEALLRPHTNLGVQDAVRALQQYIVTHIDNQTTCTLTLFNITDENIIISARLHDPRLKSIDLLRREKEECTPILEIISRHVNSEHSELQAHRLLSIFKMSEVEVVWPEKSNSVSISKNIVNIFVMFIIFLTNLLWSSGCLHLNGFHLKT